MPQLVFIEGERTGSLIELARENTIGSDPESSIFIEEKSVALRHAVIEHDGRAFQLQSLNRGCHVSVNGVTLERKSLSHGDIISFGNVMLLFSDETRNSNSRNGPPDQGEPARSNIQSRLKQARDARELVLTLKSGGRATEQLESLYRVSSTLSKSLDLDTVCGDVTRILSKVFEPDRIFLLMKDARGELEIRTQHVRTSEGLVGRDPVRMPLVCEAIDRREGILTTGPKEPIGRRAFDTPAEPQATQSAMCVPLIQGQTVIGAILIDQVTSSRKYTAEDLKLFSGVGMQVAVALENVRRYNRSIAYTKKLRALADASYKISATLDVEPLMRLAVEQACKILGASKASLLLLNEDRRTMSIGYSNCVDRALWPSIRISASQGANARVLRENRPLMTSNAPELQACLPRGREPSSYLMAPVVVRAGGIAAVSRPLGVIVLTDKPEWQTFDRSDLDVLKIFAAQIGIAINNARAFEKATVDPLTKLFSRQFFFHKLEEEIKSCRAADRPLTVVMMDLDHFKAVNDQHGHPAGDEVLSQAGAVLSKAIGSEGFCGRYGGEEFVLALPRLDALQAEKIANQVREAFRSRTFRHGENKFRTTISGGVAGMSAKDTLTSLIGNADTALYASKHSGRDRVSIYRNGTS